MFRTILTIMLAFGSIIGKAQGHFFWDIVQSNRDSVNLNRYNAGDAFYFDVIGESDFGAPYAKIKVQIDSVRNVLEDRYLYFSNYQILQNTRQTKKINHSPWNLPGFEPVLRIKKDSVLEHLTSDGRWLDIFNLKGSRCVYPDTIKFNLTMDGVSIESTIRSSELSCLDEIYNGSYQKTDFKLEFYGWVGFYEKGQILAHHFLSILSTIGVVGEHGEAEPFVLKQLVGVKTGNYVLGDSTFTTWINNEREGIQQSVQLSSFPNPFNPSTTIRWQVPMAGAIKLTLHDLNGRQLRVLEAKNSVSGAFSTRLDASGLASGVYLVRLETVAGTQTTKITLLK